MEPSRSQPVCIASVVKEVFAEQCSIEERVGGWEELENFWGEEKYRLQEIDGQIRPLSSSLEDHFLNDEILNEPAKRPNFRERSDSLLELKTIVKGEDNKDVPTTYVLGGFRPQELPVIGTYVDKRILPGFKYKVRKNLTEDYLFNGKALFLEGVGLGYGKRITFQGQSLNENDNYFWSDSRVHGYGFSLQVTSPNEVYTLLDTTTKREIGRVSINEHFSDNVEVSSEVKDNGHVKKEILIEFTCDVTLSDSLNQQNIFMDDVTVKGLAVVIREGVSARAKVEKIILQKFVLQNCQLVPEE